MNSDFIEIYDDALSKEKCREIISYFDKKKKELGRGVSGRKKLVDLSAKSCWELPAELTYLSNRSFLPSRYILDVIKKCTPQYSECRLKRSVLRKSKKNSFKYFK